MEFSPQQKQAIFARGDSLLVSAAAGSGKTAVLVRRVIERILAGGDIDRLLIVTFTHAASAEMRQKIESALREKLAAHPESDHLYRQLLKLPAAPISTVHVACERLLRQHFEAAGVDAGVSVGDEAMLDIMFAGVLEDFADELCERAQTEPDIAALLDVLSGGKDDQRLLGALQSAYEYLNKQPFPDRCVPPHTERVFDLFDGAFAARVDGLLERAEEAYRFILYDESMRPLVKTNLWKKLETERAALETVRRRQRAGDYDGMREALYDFSFADWKTKGKAYEASLSLCEIAGTQRAIAKNAVTRLQKFLQKDERSTLADIRRGEAILDRLFALAKELRARFAEQKRQRGMISFDDVEHLTLSILLDDYDEKTEKFTPSALALALREEYDEIIVDEYQDTNRKQDLIFRALSKNEKNLFMVGDIKQSIYRFRQACPALFAAKRQAATEADGTELHAPSYLYLNRNYRSHPTLLAFANRVFSACMTETLGQVNYDENERLNDGGLYPAQSQGTVEIDLLVNENDDEALADIEAEAEFVADKIRALHGTPFYDVRTGAVRPLEYGDMAILCRTASGVTGHFERALGRRGIGSVNYNQDQKFLDVWEIKMLRAFLQVLDNPYRDIPLITVMYSDFYGFTVSELAAIRARDKRVPFYDAVRLAAETDPKCERLLDQIERLRRAAVGRRTYEVLERIFAETFILEKIARCPDGQTRVANMRLMMRYALDYERDSYKGLFAFLKYLDKMSALDEQLLGAGQAETLQTSVRIMSVHKSKGLEFPVCFLVHAGKLHKDRENGVFICADGVGAAIKMRSDRDFIEYETLPHMLVHDAAREAALSEEMRILYVALTRPKTHLYITECAKEDELDKLMAVQNGGQMPDTPAGLSWILYALRGDASVEILRNPAPRKRHFGAPQQAAAQEAPLLYADIVGADYPFAAQTVLPVKLSVSEVKGMREKDEDAVDLIPAHFGMQPPAFLSGKASGGAVGNAVHKFMQFADFKTLSVSGGMERELERLERDAFLSAAETELVDLEQVRRFVRQPLFLDMITADRLEKEKRFLFQLPASEIFADCTQDAPVMLQGVLDCFFEKNGTLSIVDYKTDRLQSARQFIDRYAVQLRLYRRCLQQIYGKRAEKLWIYSFALDEVIEIS